MARGFELVANQVMAEEMAYAAMPYREVATVALVHGLVDVHDDVIRRSNRSAAEASKVFVHDIEHGPIHDPMLAYDLAILQDEYQTLEKDPSVSPSALAYDKAIYDDDVANLIRRYKHTLFETVTYERAPQKPVRYGDEVDLSAIDMSQVSDRMVEKSDLAAFISASGQAGSTAGRLWNQLRRTIVARLAKPDDFPSDMPWLRYDTVIKPGTNQRFDWIKDKLELRSLYDLLQWLDEHSDSPARTKAVELGTKGQHILKAYVVEAATRRHKH